MKKTNKERKRCAGKKAKTIEWIGGITSMPAYITGEGEPYRPDALFWMTEEGMILGPTLTKPGELLAKAAESLQSAIEQPEAGFPTAPNRVRTASPELADALRARHPWIEVVCAPTPEMDEMLLFMSEEMDADGIYQQSYLSRDVTSDAVASFFRAAAQLYRAGIWKLVPDDESLFSVTIEKLELLDAVMLVTGRNGQAPGLVLFSSPNDFEMYIQAVDSLDQGHELEMPSRFVFTFERGAELEPDLRREISRYEWEVAAANAYPWLAAIDEELVARPPTVCEITMAEAIALALTKIPVNKREFQDAWKRGEPVTRTYVVNTHRGEVEVTLRAPVESSPIEF